MHQSPVWVYCTHLQICLPCPHLEMSSDKIHRPGNRPSSWWSWLGHREAVWRCLLPEWKECAYIQDSQSSWHTCDTANTAISAFSISQAPPVYQAGFNVRKSKKNKPKGERLKIFLGGSLSCFNISKIITYFFLKTRQLSPKLLNNQVWLHPTPQRHWLWTSVIYYSGLFSHSYRSQDFWGKQSGPV